MSQKAFTAVAYTSLAGHDLCRVKVTFTADDCNRVGRDEMGEAFQKFLQEKIACTRFELGPGVFIDKDVTILEVGVIK